MFPGLSKDDSPDGEAWAIETVELITHNGTHLDAPYHYASTMNRGQRAITIDEVPLEWCFQPGVKLDFRHFPDGYVASAADIEAELDRIHHKIQPLEIVVNTSAGERYGASDYVHAGCVMGREATLYHWNEECGSRARMDGAGMRPSCLRRKVSPKQGRVTNRSSLPSLS